MIFVVLAFIACYLIYHLIHWWDEVRADRWRGLPPEKRTE